MGRNWNNKEDRKKMLKDAKILIDRILSQGKAVTNADLYLFIDREIGFEPLSSQNPTYTEVNNYEYTIQSARRTMVSETMRWIKNEILRRNLRLEESLEEVKVGRQWQYKYLIPNFSIFSREPIKRDPTSNLDVLLYRASRCRVNKNSNDFSKNSSPIDYNAIITNYNIRIEQLKKLRDREIQESFDHNVLLIHTLREFDDKVTNDRIIEIVQNGITFFSEIDDKSYLLEFLYMGVVLNMFTDEQKQQYADQFIGIIRNSSNKDLIDSYAIYTALVYAEKGTLDINEKIENKETYLHKALELLYAEDQKDKDVLWSIARVYSYCCFIYAHDYPEKTIEYGKKLLQLVDVNDIPAYSEVAKSIYNMHISYVVGLDDYEAAERILKEGVTRIRNAAPEYKDCSEIWLDLFNRSIESIIKLREEFS